MRHPFFYRMQWFFLMGYLLGLWGCASMMEAIPTPPDFFAPVQLNGPYDADIPIPQVNQIKRASFVLDGAVPYIFISVGTHFESAGDQERSIHFFNRAIDEFRKRKNVSGEGSAFSRKISALMGFGNLQAAYLVISEQEKKWSHAPFNAFIFYNYGDYYLKTGHYTKARKYFEQAIHANPHDLENSDLLALRRDTELKYGMTLIFADYIPAVAGRLCLKDFDEEFGKNVRPKIVEGLSHLERVPVLNHELQNKPLIRYFPGMIPLSLEINLYNFLGFAYGVTGKIPEAVSHFERAADIALKSGYRLGEADRVFFLSHVYLIDKNRDKGIKAAKNLEDIARRNGVVSYLIWAKMMLAHHYKETGDIDRTIAVTDEALTLMENNASGLSRKRDFRSIGFFKQQAIYEVLLELYAGKGDERRAFKTAERSKAAVPNDLLTEDVSGTTPVMGEALKRMHSLLGEAPSDVEDIQRVMAPDTTLFAYYAGAKSLYIWVISKNGFHQKKIGMSRNDVDQLVQIYLRTISSQDKNQINVLSESVYDVFLKPVIHFVSGDRLGIVPHGKLYDLPFASMRYVKAYLVDGFTIFYLPHAGMIKQALPKKIIKQTRKVLIVADLQRVEKQKTVAYAEAEMEMLKRLFPQADYVFRENESSTHLQKPAGGYDILHFAADCCFNQEAPLESGWILSANGTCHGGLTMHDIVRLQLNGRMTMLSNCRATHTGMLSLTGAWLYAVSPSIIASRWKVEDRAKAVWMEMFYKNLEQSGNSADAVRKAQNGMIQMGYGPTDWAAFALIGHD